MVRKTLHAKQLMPEAKKKLKRNPPKPRFFERSTPNQMWQCDIFKFHLSGQDAYLIGFIDDHSRYIVGLGLYRSQTAENVLEVYQRATGDYGVPKEMLTDNGRQYTNWRGKTRFEKVMQRDRVHHFRSSPHHPQTLGKIERFWKTIWEEFLSRAQFDTFESARERIAWWVKYYNQQRPHQGIDGLCPADRFFAIQKELGEVMRKGMEANLKELALRGKPQEPVYVVGRVGDRSVVIRSEQGTVRMTVGEREGEKDEHNNCGEKESTGTAELQCEGERDGVAGGVVGTPPQGACVQGTRDQLGAVQQLGEAGDSRDQGGLGGSAGQAANGAGGVGPTGAEVGIAAGENGAGETCSDAGKDGGGAGEELNSRNDEEVCDENGRVGNGRNEHGGNGSLPRGVGVMVGEADGGSGLPGDGGDAQGVAAMAGAGYGGDAAGVAAEGGPGGRTGSGGFPEGQEVAGSQGAGTGRAAAPADQAAGEHGDAAGAGVKGELSNPLRMEQ
jgi:transposase-like protein